MHRALDRRAFAKGIAVSGVGVAASSLVGCGGSSAMAQSSSTDTAQQIFTAALVAEDIATVMYYNALVGPVIEDTNLAGPGGTATSNTGSQANVGYLRAALTEEIAHANFLRTMLGASSSVTDPIQTFYFPTGTFDNLANFFPVLISLEETLIGTYITAVQEFGLMAANIAPYSSSQVDSTGAAVTPATLISYAKTVSSILAVEASHRVLARAIPPGPTFNGVQTFPADDLNYESTDGLTSVYNGSASTVGALQPFIVEGTNATPYTLGAALDGAASVQLPATGMPPS